MLLLGVQIYRWYADLGIVSQKERARFELRKLRLPTEEASPAPRHPPPSPRAKRRKIVDTREYDYRSASPSDSEADSLTSDGEHEQLELDPSHRDTIKVVRLAWLEDCFARGRLVDYQDYLVFESVRKSTEAGKSTAATAEPTPTSADELLRRAREVAAGSSQTSTPRHTAFGRHRDGGHHHKAPSLLPTSTTDENAIANMPSVPDQLNLKFSCQRRTVAHPPNEAFIEKLKEIRTLRAMRGDQIGVRAYSTAIASLSAYPHKLQSPIGKRLSTTAPCSHSETNNHRTEIPRLPGCGERYAELFAEFENTGSLGEIERAASDTKMQAIKVFYNIWGVSAVTAEEFWRKGWRDLDDVIEFGWKDISRVQQIGVKYYDEFLEKIPRAESESIANTILAYANKLRPGFHMTIVGGYRRGKEMSGDVDLMLSHPDEDATRHIIKDLVKSLEQTKFISELIPVHAFLPVC